MNSDHTNESYYFVRFDKSLFITFGWMYIRFDYILSVINETELGINNFLLIDSMKSTLQTVPIFLDWKHLENTITDIIDKVAEKV